MIDEQKIQHIAKLARLEISKQEAVEYASQLSKALAYFEQISKIETKGIEPLVTPTEIEIYWRADVAKRDFTVEEMIANAPQKTGNLFTVPPVV